MSFENVVQRLRQIKNRTTVSVTLTAFSKPP